ncbi:MAG TPA: Gfo/Idh/MocA family oxidoreductase [Firmicutes bacterium]|nr:Gfo/Idh/MocA family oxidoreductase [Bacillota bacterium]
MKKNIRWGIMGPGNIAHKFAAGLAVVPDAELAAVASRSLEKANAFADKYNIPLRYGSYEDLAADDSIDVVYVATPHSAHLECALLCLEAGRAVLCEKPLTVNAAQAQKLIATARERRVFLMEAMWTRFFPIMKQVEDWLAAGAIGEVRLVSADFGFRGAWNPEGRLFKPELAGGSLLDVGVYTVSFAEWVMGEPPQRITGLAHLGETGVDEQAAMVLAYNGGRLATLTSAVRTTTIQSAWIYGTGGYIHLPAFWHPTAATLNIPGKEPLKVEIPLLGNGYNYEAAAVNQCLKEGKLECERMPHRESLSILKTMDTLRRQWGLKYPMEE